MRTQPSRRVVNAATVVAGMCALASLGVALAPPAHRAAPVPTPTPTPAAPARPERGDPSPQAAPPVVVAAEVTLSDAPLPVFVPATVGVRSGTAVRIRNRSGHDCGVTVARRDVLAAAGPPAHVTESGPSPLPPGGDYVIVFDGGPVSHGIHCRGLFSGLTAAGVDQPGLLTVTVGS